LSSFLAEFGDLLHDPVTVETVAGREQIGNEVTYNQPQSVMGRWVRRPRLARQGDGALIMSSSFVRIPVVEGLTPEGRVTLPDGSQPPIVSVETSPDEDGNLYAMRVSFV
jgi:hypothetical protein